MTWYINQFDFSVKNGALNESEKIQTGNENTNAVQTGSKITEGRKSGSKSYQADVKNPSKVKKMDVEVENIKKHGKLEATNATRK